MLRTNFTLRVVRPWTNWQPRPPLPLAASDFGLSRNCIGCELRCLRLAGACGPRPAGSGVPIASRALGLRIIGRCTEAANFRREEPGELDSGLVFHIGPDNLYAHRQPRRSEANWRYSRRKISKAGETGPKKLIVVVFSLAVYLNLPVRPFRLLIVGKRCAGRSGT